MSQSPEVAAGDKVINFCPICGIGFTEPVALNIKISCPEEAGCGNSYLVKKL